MRRCGLVEIQFLIGIRWRLGSGWREGRTLALVGGSNGSEAIAECRGFSGGERHQVVLSTRVHGRMRLQRRLAAAEKGWCPH